MIGSLVFILTVTLATSLESKKDGTSDDELKKIIAKYVEKIPDLPPKYVINERLNKMISKYYNGKINTFPLYKITLKIDRNPVKIPWTLGESENLQNETKPLNDGKKYNYFKIKKPSPDTKTQRIQKHRQSRKPKQ